ncbi:ATP-dependent RNA helicase RhlE [Pseudovibrio axinellae]|uniref:ATP-dependent RNA helicase RhlE n=1 Tax=Pseudovibrio axinellae TaxID=989403 RepID=A0A161XGF0_9HYPH|nr:DEAD/DEAH box helicase [Pseudovibrio axinellae]KZL20918.1 ATP-dependent RNA helicase RhlE [Pseudovibrio axinellae]SEQ65875.1 ATP-dependent RNA helicase RhlE [Pseudovibrio axinellae]
MKTFADAGLAEPILRAVTAQGYENPTPIQSEVIPVMSAGEDVLGIAQTGTGKTAAFVLPLLTQLAKERKKPEPHTCRALILAPTRELASQIAESVRTYGQFIGPSFAVIFGGVKHGPQLRALSRGLDIVIATPGRLEDHMSTGGIKLSATTTIVLDEADQMLDLGFAPAIRRILSKLPKPRQTVLLSATMPTQIRKLAKEFLNNPKEISVAPVSRPIEKIEQSVRLLNASAKRAALQEILSEADVERAIVFTRTKRGADRVSGNLEKAGLSSAAIHGNKSQRQRERSLNGFKDGSVKILVATDIAARGIDIDGVSHVVNFELPNVPEAYVHRIGRTARAGKSGIAISLCDQTEQPYLRDIERLIGRKLATGDSDWAPGTPEAEYDPATEPHRLKRHKRPQNNRRRTGGGNPRSGAANGRSAGGNGGRPAAENAGEGAPRSAQPKRGPSKFAAGGKPAAGGGRGRPGKPGGKPNGNAGGRNASGAGGRGGAAPAANRQRRSNRSAPAAQR